MDIDYDDMDGRYFANLDKMYDDLHSQFPYGDPYFDHLDYPYDDPYHGSCEWCTSPFHVTDDCPQTLHAEPRLRMRHGRVEKLKYQARGCRGVRRFIKRQTRRAMRRLGKQFMEDGPTTIHHIVRGWVD